MQHVLGSVHVVYNKKMFSTDIGIWYVFVFWYNFIYNYIKYNFIYNYIKYNFIHNYIKYNFIRNYIKYNYIYYIICCNFFKEYLFKLFLFLTICFLVNVAHYCFFFFNLFVSLVCIKTLNSNLVLIVPNFASSISGHLFAESAPWSGGGESSRSKLGRLV